MKLDLRLPHTDQLVSTLIDSQVYEELLLAGWGFVLNRSGEKLYVKIFRTVDGVREAFFLHRYLFTMRLRLGHWFECHHINFDTLNNQLDNLAFIPQKLHRKIHAVRRKNPDCETEHLLANYILHREVASC